MPKFEFHYTELVKRAELIRRAQLVMRERLVRPRDGSSAGVGDAASAGLGNAAGHPVGRSELWAPNGAERSR